MSPIDQRRLVGAYVAFEPSVSDPIAMTACDDDGDYVVVVSDAMLRLVACVARAATYDDANSNHKVEEYGSFLAVSQVPGRRLLPPPPGFYGPEKAANTYEDRLTEALAFVVARELAHLRAGDLVCPKPTATRESGDDQWTASEERKALETAKMIYPGRSSERDTEAMMRVLEVGHTERGALSLLRFFTQFEAERRFADARFAPTYGLHHPVSASRLAVVKQALEAHKNARQEASK
jgi:hypothetical protein